MAIPVLIIGQSGSGKSRAIKTLPLNKTLIINVEGKAFPFREKFPYVMNTDNPEAMKAQMAHMGGIKRVVIDDAGYIMTNMFMRGHSDGRSGSKVFDLYNDIGDTFWGLINFIKRKLPEDVIVYILMHEDESDSGKIKPKTIGKMLDDKVCLEGMFTICLRCMSRDGKHFFRTVTDSYDTAKSPEGMFEAEEIPNDLELVDKCIREYYGFIEKEETNNAEAE